MSTYNNKTALLVDDDLDIIFQVSSQLKEMGFTVVTAESQKEAEKYLDSNKPDIAIFDLTMENGDSGFILCYKTKKKYPATYTMLLTSVTADTGMTFGLVTEDDRRWVRADSYIEKGFRPEQIQMEIERLFAGK